MRAATVVEARLSSNPGPDFNEMATEDGKRLDTVSQAPTRRSPSPEESRSVLLDDMLLHFAGERSSALESFYFGNKLPQHVDHLTN